jgi:hypothetical protein
LPAPAQSILTSARNAGWRNTVACEPGAFLHCVALLALGLHHIPVRHLVFGPDAETAIPAVSADMSSCMHPEQFLILDGFSERQREAVRAHVVRAGRRHHVGTRAEFEQWLISRLGPLAILDAASPLRQLLEAFASYLQAASPAERYPMDLDYMKGSRINGSFNLGALGSQAIATLFGYVIGAANIENVEHDPAYQKQGIDFLIRGSAGGGDGARISTDVKAEAVEHGDRPSPNISLETMSSYEAQTLGWLYKSLMAALTTVNWLTGDVFFMDFAAIKAWIVGGEHGLRETFGHAPGQSYRSRILLLPAKTLFEKFPDKAMHLRLRDWLPVAYGDQFKYPSVVPARFASRTLIPQR